MRHWRIKTMDPRQTERSFGAGRQQTGIQLRKHSRPARSLPSARSFSEHDGAPRAAVADGKRRLIGAGLRLAARGRSLPALGLRELAREAGLNPNTFYRHFRNMEELGLAAVEEVTRRLRLGLKQVRRGAVKRADATLGSAEYFLEFARHNREAFVVGLREIHGASPAIRRALRKVLEEIALEIAHDIRSLALAPTDDPKILIEVARAIVDLMFYRSLDYIEHPAKRRLIADQSVRVARMLFMGAAGLAQKHLPDRRARS